MSPLFNCGVLFVPLTGLGLCWDLHSGQEEYEVWLCLGCVESNAYHPCLALAAHVLFKVPCHPHRFCD